MYGAHTVPPLKDIQGRQLKQKTSETTIPTCRQGTDQYAYQRLSKYLYLGAHTVHSMDKNQIGNTGEQPFLHVTHQLDLIYMFTKYLYAF